MRGLEESPLIAELVAIGKGEEALPKSEAKRHHFIPKLLLNGFTGTDGLLRQLDKRSGAIQETDVPAAASQRWYYRFADADGEQTNELEAYFALVEGHGAAALRRVEESGELSEADRATISFFLAVLWARTPGARELGAAVSQEVFKMSVASHYADPADFRASYRTHEAENGADHKSDEEVEAFRQEVLRSVAAGAVKIHDPGGQNVMSLLLENAVENVPLIYAGTSWGLMRAGESEFLASDRGLAVFDPARPFPWVMDALFSSPRSQSTTPISSASCLIVVPGEPCFKIKESEPREVEIVNLGTYGWADRFVFGSDAERVQALAATARAEPERAPGPKPFRNIILLEGDPDDECLARAHRERGWPAYMRPRGEDGTVRTMDYMVVGADGDAVEIGVKSSELARRRGLKAAGLPPDAEVEGSVRTEVLHPTDLL